jgi:SnoaL-like domain
LKHAARGAEKGNNMTTERTLELVRAYYESWNQGIAHYDEARLRRVMHPKLAFESPIGKKAALDEFLPGLQRFSQTVRGFTMLQLIGSGNEAAAIYDCLLTRPVDVLRCAEVFRVEGEQIVSLRLVFDATPYKSQAA